MALAKPSKEFPDAAAAETVKNDLRDIFDIAAYSSVRCDASHQESYNFI